MENKAFDAFQNGNLLKLLRGDYPYNYLVYSNMNNVIPTNIEEVVSDIFKVYELNSEVYYELKELLSNMTVQSASDYYLVWQYVEYILYRESKGTATFSIIDNELISKMQLGARKFYNQLQSEIVFNNGLEKQEPWKSIESSNRFIKNKFNLSILE
ncbi:hypothetical protein HO665_04600 [Streptococcus suis]|nr:hypothetical protein [Streptococcus suis]